MILDGGPVGIGLESTIVDFTEEIPTILRPGYINQEMVRRVIGQVQMDRGLIQADSKVKPKAPGMKYRPLCTESGSDRGGRITESCTGENLCAGGRKDQSRRKGGRDCYIGEYKGLSGRNCKVHRNKGR